MTPPRRPTSAIDKAEAMFKQATTKPVEAAPKAARTSIPVGKETVSIKIDNDILAFFQDEGPGWQERINQALRVAAELD